MLGNTEFSGKITGDVTMPASGAVKVTFSGTVNTDNVKYDASNNGAVVKFNGANVTLGNTIVYAENNGTKITDVSKITSAVSGFKYNATADGSNPGWKAEP